MEVTTQKRESDTLVNVEGRLDIGNATILEERLMPLAQEEQVFTLDFAGVPYISSAGIRTLLSLHRTVSGKGGSVTLINACDQVREILEETEFDELFNL